MTNKFYKWGSKLKKLIYYLGILFLVIIIILNFAITSFLDKSEHIIMKFNSFLYIAGIIVLGLFVYFITKTINKYLYDKSNFKTREEERKIVFKYAIRIYVVLNIIWAITVNPKVIGDSVHVCNLAQTFYRGNLQEFLPDITYLGVPLYEYMQIYPQQITLAFVYNIFFRIICFDIMEVLRVLNIISNVLIVIALYKINVQLSKKYETNKPLLFTLIVTFISLIMLVTFIYGDIPGLALSLWSTYFIMKYVENKKMKNFVLATILMMIAYMMRMNCLIFIIATIIYLVLNLIEKWRLQRCKQNVFSILMIFIYISVSLIPASLVKNYYLNKYHLDKERAYPIVSYFLMAMEESPRGNGWYNEDIAKKAVDNPDEIEEEYTEKIKNRLIYFSENLEYTFKFYTEKIASMWTENTYSAVRNNTIGDSNRFEKLIEPLTFYQKTLLILTCICSIIVLIQNRKNLSLEVIFLLTIFIGGFAFHILWEAKSRYIIPYIVVLIPIAAISIKKTNLNLHFFRRKKDS